MTTMSMPGRKKTFRFLDLPPEIRCHVYNYLALKAQCAITLRRHPTGSNIFGQAYAIVSRECKPGLNAAIIFVNRLIYTETMPFLYSVNSFTATDPAVMTSFVLHIGCSIEHLTQIGVAYTSILEFKADFRTMINVLAGAKKLKVLEISQMIYDPGVAWSPLLTCAADVLQELMPLLKALDRDRPKETGGTRLASQLLSVRITPPPEDGYWERLYADVGDLEGELKTLMENTVVS
ncbi:hypothetical protein PRZ48_011599 [Zasmidium cellare]|uniref:F-box domain-containing protein n=1 Tax=Zasmidium cellare TaxID=395010 RepID=A0ABR0E6T8_ZASCE|nr:hypothetical protein PRZ48_011599 [Zasmidium cellare]